MKRIQRAARIGCDLWSATQDDPSTWNEDLPPCPNTFRQASVARGQYEPDRLCRQGGLPLINCWFHQGRQQFNEENAAACFRSVRSNSHGAASQCCYDDAGQIITRGTGAGTDDRYHSGQSFWRHQFHDVLTFLACCKLQSNPESCDRYLELRPSRPGSNTNGQFGGTWGDPHFMTLDGTSYTFNGYGEYVYLAIPTEPSVNYQASSALQFESQIRTVPFQNDANKVTAIKAFAARMNLITVSITVSRRNQLLVHLNQEEVAFVSDQDTDIQSETITINSENFSITKNVTSNQITLVWIVGVSIKVTPVFLNTESTLVLNVAAAVSGDLKGNWTLGLVGGYDGNAGNDLRTKNGTVIGTVESLSLRQIHELFGVTWAISPNRSLFYYESPDSASFYESQNLNYIPNFNDTASVPLETNVLLACAISLNSSNTSQWSTIQRTCYYDAVMTGDLAFGISSRRAAEEQFENRESLLNPPNFNANLTRTQKVRAGELVNLSFQATSEFSLIIVYKFLNNPSGSTLDEQTGQFHWRVPAETRNGSEHPVKVSATDGAKNLTSAYEVLLIVEGATDEQSTTSTTTISSIASSSTEVTQSTMAQTTSVPLTIAGTITPGNTITIILNTLSPKFRRIGGSSTNYYYSVVLIAISRSGLYTFTSSSNVATHGMVYMNNFDPENLNSNLLTQDNDSDNSGRYRISVYLQSSTGTSKQARIIRASTTYYLITTTRDPEATGSVFITADGPIRTGTNNTGLNNDSGQAEKIIAITIGTVIGTVLILGFCFTLCALGICLPVFCFKGTPVRTNKAYVSSGIGMYNDRNNAIFRPGSYSSFYVKDGSLRGPYNLVLRFYPTGGHIVYGKGKDDVGEFIIKGTYSTRTLRMGLEKLYQKGTGDSNANVGHAMTIQVQWNKSAQNFDGKYYLKNGKHRDEQKYIIRTNHASHIAYAQ